MFVFIFFLLHPYPEKQLSGAGNRKQEETLLYIILISMQQSN